MLAAKPTNTFSEALDHVPPNLREKAERIRQEIAGLGSVIVAFSGGVDSTLVAYLAKMAVGENVVAVTADSPSLPQSELAEARELAKLIGIRHMTVRTEELEDIDYVSNPANRCYFCKKELSQKLIQLAADLSIPAILDGTNAEDLRGHRPGASALSEHGIKRPLANAHMSKVEVRELAKAFGLPNYDKPSMPCLSSRVQYGETITPERLRRIEKSETLVKSLTGVKELRVRDHGNLARIEVGRNERSAFFNEATLDGLGKGLRELGFVYVTFDLFGYRTGSMNELVKIEGPPVIKAALRGYKS